MTVFFAPVTATYSGGSCFFYGTYIPASWNATCASCYFRNTDCWSANLKHWLCAWCYSTSTCWLWPGISKNSSIAFANCFRLLLSYCCNQILMYPLHNVSLHIVLQYVTKFDSMIKQMIAKYFNLNHTSDIVLENIVPGSRLALE